MGADTRKRCSFAITVMLLEEKQRLEVTDTRTSQNSLSVRASLDLDRELGPNLYS